ncbi:chemotaxis protein CheD [Sulfitobacter sp. F26204]|uniref:chemotaxis protein CheD n=1 Tax=Sulfitobacter sp. F26204 TaxID=2996014 RepID=UPI00225E28A7|nr:chemotaxis protein CheD [Sulfitobacter sp. F26204]MCX7559774.1 chemotaxis protein CheD [Sulfitobacter sp. F26204]
MKQFVITQGEFFVSSEVGTTISTLLGSCVACCLWDPLVAVGGMNHILFASLQRNRVKCDRAGINAMELLINEMLKRGAHRARLKAKLFGGAQMIDGLSEIGPANSTFATQFLAVEGIECISSSLGGSSARHLVFTPTTGAARVKIPNFIPKETLPSAKPENGNDLELF